MANLSFSSKVRKKQAALFGERLRAAINKKCTTARDLAAVMGIDESMISHMCSGRRTPCLENLRRLALALKLDPVETQWLVLGEVTYG